MKSFFRTFYIALAFALAVFTAGATAQTPRPAATPPPTDDTGGQVKTFEVRLPVTVTLKKELVTGLSRGDFVVFEDGVQQEITSFTDSATNPPVYVGVLMTPHPPQRVNSDSRKRPRSISFIPSHDCAKTRPRS